MLLSESLHKKRIVMENCRKESTAKQICIRIFVFQLKLKI
jgi:hypothetical protein